MPGVASLATPGTEVLSRPLTVSANGQQKEAPHMLMAPTETLLDPATQLSL